MKTKTKRLAVCALACALTATAGAMFAFPAVRYASAQETCAAENASPEASPRALFTVLDLSMEGSDGEVRAVVKNKFTFLPGVNEVQIELYSSVDYTTDPSEMQLERRIYIGDLDQGKSLVARASTDGEQRFWYAIMDADIDGQNEQRKTLGPWLFDAGGNRIESWEQ